MSSLSSRVLHTAFRERSASLSLVASLSSAIFLYFKWCCQETNETDIYELEGFSIVAAWRFFSGRFDFLQGNFDHTGQKMFLFKVLNSSVVATKGDEARKIFFTSPSLNVFEGYRRLLGGIPRFRNFEEASENAEDVSFFHKQTIVLFDKDHFANVLPDGFDDIQRRMETWGEAGLIDPFKDISDLVMQMSCSLNSCRELATDVEAMRKLEYNYEIIRQSATPMALIFPWLPNLGLIRKAGACWRLYNIFHGYVEQRKKAVSNSCHGAIDFLLARGLESRDIIGVLLGIIFAAVVSISAPLTWTLFYLSIHKEWKQKVIDEVEALVRNHSDDTLSDPIHKRLAAIPISVWETETPIIDLVIRETLRFVVNGTAIRRNLFEDINIAGKHIPKRHYLLYCLSDAHMNPDIYTNPDEFDPARFLPGRAEDKKSPYAYLGWGAGRHVCPGNKLSKLVLKATLSLFLMTYDYEVVNSEGEALKQVPKSDHNDIHARWLGGPCYIKLKRVAT